MDLWYFVRKKAPYIWHLLFGIHYLAFVIWYTLFGICYLVYIIWYLLFGIHYLVFVIWYTLFGICLISIWQVSFTLSTIVVKYFLEGGRERTLGTRLPLLTVKKTFQMTQEGEKTPHEWVSSNVSFNFTGIFRPRCNLDMQFSELNS